MKTLVEYIHEAVKLNEAKDSKSFSFNFAGMNEKEDFLKSFDSFECVNVDEDTVKVNVSNSDECAKVFELIQDVVHARKNDIKFVSDESYAQKVHSLENKLSDWQDFLDELESGEDDEKKEADDKGEAGKKEEDKKEEE